MYQLRIYNCGGSPFKNKKTGETWVSIKNVHNGLGGKNMSDVILEETYGRYRRKNLTNEKIKKWKMTEREIFEKYANLSEDELNTKSNKNVYVRNDVMTTVIKRYRGDKKRIERKRDGFRKRLMIPESEISERPEYNIKSKIRNEFVNEKNRECHCVKIYEIDRCFYQHYEKKKKLMKMDVTTYYSELMVIFGI